MIKYRNEDAVKLLTELVALNLDHVGVIKNAIREFNTRHILSGGEDIETVGLAHLTVMNNGQYRKGSFIDGTKLRLSSAYVGKKGNIIFTFGQLSSGATGQIEIKLDDCAKVLNKSFAIFIDDYLMPLAGGRLDYARGKIKKMQEEERNRLRMEEEERQRKKAEKYSEKKMYASW